MLPQWIAAQKESPNATAARGLASRHIKLSGHFIQFLNGSGSKFKRATILAAWFWFAQSAAISLKPVTPDTLISPTCWLEKTLPAKCSHEPSFFRFLLNAQLLLTQHSFDTTMSSPHFVRW
jgi:hypothetical protein